jgi:hypothetical protein
MARTDVGAALTAEHRSRQLSVRAQTVREFQTLFTLWDPARPATFDRLVTATVPLIDLRRGTSAGIAADYFAAFRMAEQVDGPSSPRLAGLAPREKLLTSLYVTGRNQIGRSVAAGLSPQAAVRTAFVTMSGAVSRHVLDAGRTTIIDSAVADPKTVGWQRVTDGDPCSFCAMLASRGAAYRQDTVGFQAHDHCGCTAEPRYEGSRMTSDAQRWRSLWNESTRGTSGRDALNAFRRAYEAA